MERYITNEIYNHLAPSNSLELANAESELWGLLSELVPKEKHLRVEEKLNEVLSIVEEEDFHLGFNEGMRCILKCM